MPLTLRRLLKLLRDEYGDPGWWPGDSPFEVAVGAILTQRSSWRNVELAVANLRRRRMLSPRAIAAATPNALEFAIRPSGFYKQKAKYLIAFAEHLVSRHKGRIENMCSLPVPQLRKELMALPGIGPETADSILLYALGKPSFVVDAYTVRLMSRLGMGVGKDYDATKEKFETALRGKTKDYCDMHALIVVHCKERCRALPLCPGCPLAKGCSSKRNEQ
ncbi:MAG: endonuclease III domain-containing protein [Thermoplasmata archaeon]